MSQAGSGRRAHTAACVIWEVAENSLESTESWAGRLALLTQAFLGFIGFFLCSAGHWLCAASWEPACPAVLCALLQGQGGDFQGLRQSLPERGSSGILRDPVKAPVVRPVGNEARKTFFCFFTCLRV